MCCIANYDEARVEIVFSSESKEENKAAFDKLYIHKADIEAALNTELQWSRGDDIKSAKAYVKLSGVSIENETDWLQMSRFHADWAKKFYDVIVPYIKNKF